MNTAANKEKLPVAYRDLVLCFKAGAFTEYRCGRYFGGKFVVIGGVPLGYQFAGWRYAPPEKGLNRVQNFVAVCPT
jgi:hypothetical protein